MPLDNLKCPACGRKQGHLRTRLIPGSSFTDLAVSVPVVVCHGCKAASIGKVIVCTREEPQRGRTPEAMAAYAREVRKLADQKRSEIESLNRHLVVIEEEAQRLEDELRRGGHDSHELAQTKCQ